MIRDEAIAQAIECAELADMVPPVPADRLAALARVGDLWLGIADRLPIVREPEPDASPTGPRFPAEVLDQAREEDGDLAIVECGHRMMALLHRGRWLHPYSLDVCDDPPTARAEQ
jgi:hypothetical protein